MKGTEKIEDTKGGEWKLKQCNSQKSTPFYKCWPASFYRETNKLLHSEITLVRLG
jgi:hypothetical protein